MKINKMTLLCLFHSLSRSGNCWVLSKNRKLCTSTVQGRVTSVTVLTTAVSYVSVRFEMSRQGHILIEPLSLFSAYILAVVNSSGSDVLSSSSSSSSSSSLACSGEFFSSEVDIHLVGQNPAIYKTQNFIATFKHTHQLSISWARWVQSTCYLLVSAMFLLLFTSRRRPEITHPIFF